MKLIDILAREFKVWPKRSAVITQDSDGMLNRYPAGSMPMTVCNNGRVWSGGAQHLVGFSDGDDDVSLPVADDQDHATITRAQWQSAVDALAAQDMHDMALSAEPGVIEATAWNGEGLPPVGTEFESKAGKGWCECIAVAHDGGFVVFRRYFKGSEYGIYGHCYAGSDQMRPIRSAEQIEAEEREAEIHDLVKILGEVKSAVYKDIAKAIQKAGYRKQVAK